GNVRSEQASVFGVGFDGDYSRRRPTLIYFDRKSADVRADIDDCRRRLFDIAQAINVVFQDNGEDGSVDRSAYLEAHRITPRRQIDTLRHWVRCGRPSAMSIQERAIVSIDDDGPGIVRLESLSTCRSHAGSKIRVIQQCVEFRGPVVRVARMG